MLFMSDACPAERAGKPPSFQESQENGFRTETLFPMMQPVPRPRTRYDCPMPRFVVLRHETPSTATRPSHWDLMFELGDSQLKTWALESAPDGRQEQTARRLADHRAEYLDFQGPLSGDRGHVRRWDCGICSVLSLSSCSWLFHLQGERLVGRVSLSRPDVNTEDWLYCFTPIEPIQFD